MFRFAALLLVALATFALASGTIGLGSGSGGSVEWGGSTHRSPAELSSWLEARGASYERWALLHPEAAATLEGRTGAPLVSLPLPLATEGVRTTEEGSRTVLLAILSVLAIGVVVALLVARRRTVSAWAQVVWGAAVPRLSLLREAGCRSWEAAVGACRAGGRTTVDALARAAVSAAPQLRAAAGCWAELGRRALVRLDSAARAGGSRLRAAVSAAPQLRAAAGSWAELGWRALVRLDSAARAGGSRLRAAHGLLSARWARRPRRRRRAPAATGPGKIPLSPAPVVVGPDDGVPALAPASPPPAELPEMPPEPEPEEPAPEQEPEPAVQVLAGGERCEIRVWHGYVKSQFFALNGGDGALASSPLFRRAGDVPAQSPAVLAAHEELVRQLVESGWEPDGRGDCWYAHRFRLGERV
jgi:hypothetical protein